MVGSVRSAVTRSGACATDPNALVFGCDPRAVKSFLSNASGASVGIAFKAVGAACV